MPDGQRRYAAIVPLRNMAHRVAAAIDSALAQTLRVHEIVVVDDASEDGGAEAVARIGHPRVRLLRRDSPGAGGYAARNLAIRHTECEWIAFLDADDIWSPHHLAGLDRAAREAAADCAFSSYLSVWPRGVAAAPVAPALRKAGPIGLKRFLRAWLQTARCPMLTSATVFRRDLLLDAGLFPERDARRGGDKDLWLRVMARAQAAFSPERSMRFDRTGSTKVTRTVSTAALPFILGTIETMLGQTEDAELRLLLRRLANQEIVLYARQAYLRAPLPREMRDRLFMPEGWREWSMLSAMAATPDSIAEILRKATGRRPAPLAQPASARH